MTREKMIDLAVEKSMKRPTMRNVLQRGSMWAKARKAGDQWMLDGWAKGWLEDDAPFYFFPHRLAAIRYNFRRLKRGEKMKTV